MSQKSLLDTIERSLPTNTSLIDVVAEALNISYDASHRRCSMKSKISFEESLQLATYFKCSLDNFIGADLPQIVPLEKTKHITSVEGLEEYFVTSYESLFRLKHIPDCRLYYSAKDIPIFYTLGGDLLMRFKLFVWLKLLQPATEDFSFDTFKIPLSTLEAGTKLGGIYKEFPKTEIWDTTTINSTLKQIHFYYQTDKITGDTALILCTQLEALVQDIKSKISSDTTDVLIYHNELLLMNNTVLVDTPVQKAFYVPFTILSYFLATDRITCEQASENIKLQLSHSKLLNTIGAREKHLFFQKLTKKIKALEQLIQASEVLDFE